MYVLGINESHTATAALLCDGQILACASEERFTRVKGQAGFPEHAIAWCLTHAGISSADLDLVIFGSIESLGPMVYVQKKDQSQIFLWAHTFNYVFLDCVFTVGQHVPVLLFLIEAMRSLVWRLVTPVFQFFHRFKRSRQLRISMRKIAYLDHHTAHAITADAIVEKRQAQRLVITNDGIGDRACGRVFVVIKNRWRQIAQTPNQSSVASVYYHVTKLLGFVPNEHEYKVMGLAGYANPSRVDDIYPIFGRLIWCDGLSFRSKIPTSFFSSYLKKHIREKRFDDVVGAVQRLVEELLVTQVGRAIEKTGINRVVLGGGLAMNIKANMRVAQLPAVRTLVICPSPGDESTALGSCLWGYERLCQKRGIAFRPKTIDNLYLGPESSEEEITHALVSEKITLPKYRIKKLTQRQKAVTIASLLAQGKIVARVAGRMEFGARALGNRSILADPRNPMVVRVLNEQIKNRDFWMPFAPTILKERAADYLVNPKKIDSPYMMLAFETTPRARIEIPATLHLHDYTCRPQILAKEDNPSYYDLIKAFEKITGVGALLNTSFNLHGEPIVCTSIDALQIFRRSGLQYLLLEDFLIEKQEV